MALERPRSLTALLPALPELPPTSANLPASLSGRALTRGERHVVNATKTQLAQIAGTVAKAAAAQAAMEQLSVVTYQHGMRATAAILACQQRLEGTELQQYGDTFARQLIAQSLQHMGAIAAIGSRRMAEIVDQPIDPVPVAGLLERLRGNH